MAAIQAPNPINGLHASVLFTNGHGETDDPWLIQWFREHGYEVTDKQTKIKK